MDLDVNRSSVLKATTAFHLINIIYEWLFDNISRNLLLIHAGNDLQIKSIGLWLFGVGL